MKPYIVVSEIDGHLIKIPTIFPSRMEAMRAAEVAYWIMISVYSKSPSLLSTIKTFAAPIPFVWDGKSLLYVNDR